MWKPPNITKHQSLQSYLWYWRRTKLCSVIKAIVFLRSTTPDYKTLTVLPLTLWNRFRSSTMLSPTMFCPATEALSRHQQTKIPMHSERRVDFDTTSLFRQIIAVDLNSFPTIEWSEAPDPEPLRKVKRSKKKKKKKKKKISKKAKSRSKHCLVRSKSQYEGLACLGGACSIHYF